MEVLQEGRATAGAGSCVVNRATTNPPNPTQLRENKTMDAEVSDVNMDSGNHLLCFEYYMEMINIIIQ
jgi:hypothetical protein